VAPINDRGSLNTAWQLRRPSFETKWWDPPGAVRQPRAGSYLHNMWIAGPWWWPEISRFSPPTDKFANEAEVTMPAHTPVFDDGIGYYAYIPSGGNAFDPGPMATDLPATNLSLGPTFGESDITLATLGMAAFTIPRHGSRPSRIPTNQSPDAPLPGAINAAFDDGHADQIKLEKLWQLQWHKNWQTPAKRPGLK
jgi:hypothetical protein